MKFLIQIVIMTGAALFTGCAPLRHVVSMDENSSSTNVSIIRNYNYIQGGYHFWPTVDGQDIAGLLPRQHVSFRVQPGHHVLGVRCYGGLWPKWWHDEVEIDLTTNENRYFLITPYILGCAEIDDITEEKALKRLRKSDQIKTGYMSDCNGNSIAVTSEAPRLCFKSALP